MSSLLNSFMLIKVQVQLRMPDRYYTASLQITIFFLLEENLPALLVPKNKIKITWEVSVWHAPLSYTLIQPTNKGSTCVTYQLKKNRRGGKISSFVIYQAKNHILQSALMANICTLLPLSIWIYIWSSMYQIVCPSKCNLHAEYDKIRVEAITDVGQVL